jgi:hypothetical protein
LFLVQGTHVSDHEASSQNGFLDSVPDAVLRIVELDGHPTAGLENTVELAKALFH